MISLVSILAAASLLPGFTPYAAGPDGGSVQTGTFPGEQRPGFVYLPPGFSRSHRYPVVYLLHGMPGSPSEYLVGTDLATWADTEIGNGTIRPFIAVLPAAGPRPAVQRGMGRRARGGARARNRAVDRRAAADDRGPLGAG